MVQNSQYRRQQPETLRARRIVPSLIVSDLDASLAWYRDIVGFFVKATHEKDGTPVAYTLAAGGQELTLTQGAGEHEGVPRGTGVRLFLETIQDVDLIAGAIRKRGGKLASKPATGKDGQRSFDLVDPDGLTLTIVTTV